MHLFGLLHSTAGESNAANTKIDDEQQLVELYARNAITLWRSLDRTGISFTLVCQDASRVRALASRFGAPDLDIRAIPFPLEIPSGVPFYSAHHKLDVFRHLATLPDGAYVGLVDLDVVALGELPTTLRRIIESGMPLAYDITDQVAPAYGFDVIARDLEKLTGIPSEARWYGGELLAGQPWFFRALCDQIAGCYAVYVDVWRQLHHQGDEIITSAAVQQLLGQGLQVADGGSLGITRRYWSIATLHPQPKLDDTPPPFLLHLPADKMFLASLRADEQVDARRFLTAYRRHLRRRALPNLARRALMPIRHGRRSRAPAPAGRALP
jgi:hypothetical protein